mmetsp:Transcript_154169/g.494193  ORF Transcript_154169/g.494193 Transcript_154169/m.494193 type:complete len:445 (+) Transcript_154169:219-1553(+)
MRPRGLYTSCYLGRYRFDEAPRVVHLVAPQDAHHVGEQLQRNHHHQGHQVLVRLRHADHILAKVIQLVVAVLGDGDDGAAARLDLLDVGLDLFVCRVRNRCDDHHWHEPVDQGDGAVLHLRGGVALCVDVGDLLALHGPLQGDREVEAPAKEDEIVGQHVLTSDIPQHALADHQLGVVPLQRLGAPLDHILDEVWQLLSFGQELRDFSLRQGPGRLSEGHGHDEKGEHGRGEGLGRCDTLLLSGHDAEESVTLARQRGVFLVHNCDCQDVFAILVPFHPVQALDRIRGLTGVGDHDEDVPGFEHRLLVSELRGELHLHGYSRKLLDEILRREGRVVGRATPHDQDPVLGRSHAATGASCHHLERRLPGEAVRGGQRRPEPRQVDAAGGARGIRRRAGRRLEGRIVLDKRLEQILQHLGRLPNVIEHALGRDLPAAEGLHCRVAI